MKHYAYFWRMLLAGLIVAAIVVLTGRAIDQRLGENAGGGRQQETTTPAGGIGTAIICFTRPSGKVVCQEPRP